MTELPITGVYCASVTPVTSDLAPDHSAFVAHCRRLLEQGCDGVALLGTTGEANSFSATERKALLESAVSGGIAPEHLLPGTGVAAWSETVELTKHALGLGVTRVVMLPPFYYKGISLVKMGRSRDARKEFTTVIQQFPRTEAADKAKAQMKVLGFNTPVKGRK